MYIYYTEKRVPCAYQITGLPFVKKLKDYNRSSSNSKQDILTRLQICGDYLLCGVE